MKDKLIGSLCLFAAACIWGGLYVVSKYVLEFISPIMLVWIRYVIAFLVLFLCLKLFNRNKKKSIIGKKDWFLIAWIGFIGYFVSIFLQFIGTKFSDAHTGSLITSSTPVFVVLFARFILRENFTKKKIFSLLLATFGVIIVIGLDNTMAKHLLGNVALVGAAITWALLSVYVKLASKSCDSLTITTYAMMFALIFTTPLIFLEHKNMLLILSNKTSILALLYIGIVATAGAFFLWNKGLELMDTGIGSLFLFFQPVTGSLLGWLCLHEKLSFSFLIGGILIVLAVIISAKDEGV